MEYVKLQPLFSVHFFFTLLFLLSSLIYCGFIIYLTMTVSDVVASQLTGVCIYTICRLRTDLCQLNIRRYTFASTLASHVHICLNPFFSCVHLAQPSPAVDTSITAPYFVVHICLNSSYWAHIWLIRLLPCLQLPQTSPTMYTTTFFTATMYTYLSRLLLCTLGTSVVLMYKHGVRGLE